ncbi:MAG: hypothetical protein GX547_04785 [Phycisphaerae bacterium]|nr:hypothetical protein [Phycisphaerae bacterium]
MAGVCVAYCLAHVWAEGRRRQRLCQRTPMSRSSAVAASGKPADDEASALVFGSMAKALGVPPDVLRPEDRFDRELRLPGHCLLLDEWDEEFFATLNEALAERGVPPWRGSCRGFRTIGDVIEAIQEHVRQFDLKPELARALL